MRKASADLGISTDDVLEPGYVWFDCAFWGLPENTQGKIGQHVTYRPMAGDLYLGNEFVTDKMREAAREHYARLDEVEARQKQLDLEDLKAAAARRTAIPEAAWAELRAAQKRIDTHWSVVNEGGDGYYPEVSWQSAEGRRIAEKYGFNPEAL